MSSQAAGQCRHQGLFSELSQLGSQQAITRNQRIAEQAARDAVSHWRRSTTIHAAAPEASSGAV